MQYSPKIFEICLTISKPVFPKSSHWYIMVSLLSSMLNKNNLNIICWIRCFFQQDFQTWKIENLRITRIIKTKIMGLASVLNIVLFFSFWINFFFSFILLWSSLFNFYLRSESLKQCLVFCCFVLFFCILLFLFLLLLFVWFVLFFFLSHVFFLLWLLHFVWSALQYCTKAEFIFQIS